MPRRPSSSRFVSLILPQPGSAAPCASGDDLGGPPRDLNIRHARFSRDSRAHGIIKPPNNIAIKRMSRNGRYAAPN